MFAKLWNDESGSIALEYLLLLTIVGLALVVGFSSVANALNVEYTELANAILALDQSYSYAAASTCTGSHGGVTVTESVTSMQYGHSAAVNPTISTQTLNITACP
jgi:Flp pilus assembly pilin Flp